MVAYDPSTLVFLDETGYDQRNLIRKYGYSIRGYPAQDHLIKIRGVRYSAIGILTMEGINDVYITEGTVNGCTFLDFVYSQLLSILNPFDGHNRNSVVIMDNAAIHHINDVVQAIDSVGVLIRFLPPYILARHKPNRTYI